MYYVLYIDVLFLENLLLDYLLLTVTARLLKLAPGLLRKALAAALGSALLCLVCALLPQCPPPVLLCIHGASGAVMVSVGLGPGVRRPRPFCRALLLLYLCSFLLGGIFGWLPGIIRLPVFPFPGITLAAYLILTLCADWLAGFRKREQRICSVTLGFRGRRIRARGLVDTGNSLRDPVSGKPVSILTSDLQAALCGSGEVLPYLIPFHSIGKQNGLLPAFYADFLQLETENGKICRIERPLLGITKEPLSSQNDYEILLHPELLASERPENVRPKAAPASANTEQSSGGNKDYAD